MKLKFNSSKRSRRWLLPLLLPRSASIQLRSMRHRQKHDDRGSVYYYGPAGPNVSYRSGPHTRIHVTKRLWLDAGTEILPGDRKFTDYAFPP
jgi:hypothetical protein